jgi:hypothetical protein
MRQIKSKLQTGISILFGFLLTILFVILFLCTVGYTGVFNSRSITGSMNKSDYFSKLHEVILENSAEIAAKAGLPESVLTDVITLQRVYISGSYYADNTLKGKNTQIKLENIEKELKANINQYIIRKGITLTGDHNVKIESVIEAVKQEYSDRISLSYLKSLYQLKLQYNKIMIILIPVIVTMITVICFFLIKMQKYPHKGLRFITYALTASSLILIICSFVLLMGKIYYIPEISVEYYRNFVYACLQWDIKVLLFTGGLGITIAAALISLTVYLKNNIMD